MASLDPLSPYQLAGADTKGTSKYSVILIAGRAPEELQSKSKGLGPKCQAELLVMNKPVLMICGLQAGLTFPQQEPGLRALLSCGGYLKPASLSELNPEPGLAVSFCPTWQTHLLIAG